MKLHTHIGQIPAFNRAVITIGTFDGVHRGHQQIIAQLKAEAAAIGGETVIVTFDPHPRLVVMPGHGPVQLINTLPEKEQLLAQLGVDHLVVVPFTAEFSAMSPADYIKDFLVKTFRPHTVIIGYDHKFGHNRGGDYQMLEALAPQYQFAVKEIPPHVLHHVTISSTAIRRALLEGDCATANELLGYPYFFSGLVVQGNQLGRTIGYPTANLAIGDSYKLVPGNGVYAVEVAIGSGSTAATHGGMMNIGTRPTVNGTHRMVEVNLFDFTADIYGQTLTVRVKQRLRSEQKFNGLEALKAQLAHDKQAALTALENWQQP
jgi:riboflavin kinase / FMN adenylyltransferase